MWEEQQAALDLPLPGATINSLGAAVLTLKTCSWINNKDSPSTAQSYSCGQWLFSVFHNGAASVNGALTLLQVNICPLWRESFNHRNSLGMTVSAFGMGKNLSHLLSNCEVFCEMQFGRLQLTRLTRNTQTNNCLPSGLEAKWKSWKGRGRRSFIKTGWDSHQKKKNNDGTDGFSLWTATLGWFWKDKPQHCHVLFWLPDRKPWDLATWVNWKKEYEWMNVCFKRLFTFMVLLLHAKTALKAVLERFHQ